MEFDILRDYLGIGYGTGTQSPLYLRMTASRTIAIPRGAFAVESVLIFFPSGCLSCGGVDCIFLAVLVMRNAFMMITANRMSLMFMVIPYESPNPNALLNPTYADLMIPVTNSPAMEVQTSTMNDFPTAIVIFAASEGWSSLSCGPSTYRLKNPPPITAIANSTCIQAVIIRSNSAIIVPESSGYKN